MIELSDDVVLVLTTTDDRAAAERIARACVGKRLAACAGIAETRSVYRWKGEICDASEFAVTLKTVAASADALAAEIRALHGYKTPEILVLPVRGGSPDYLAWLRAETTRPQDV